MTMFDRGLRLRTLLALFALLELAAASPNRVRAADGDAAPAGHAVLYEEDSSNPAGRKLPGSVVWHTDTTKSAGANDIFVAGDVDIPNRFRVTLTLKRNTDKTLPASHVFELTFVPVPGYTPHHINNVPGMLTKANEQARGVPFAGSPSRSSTMCS